MPHEANECRVPARRSQLQPLFRIEGTHAAVTTSTFSESRQLPQASIWQQLRPTPRIYLFALASLPAAMSFGAKELARWQYLTEAFDSEWGIAIAASTIAISLAITSLLVGRIADRSDPRSLFVASYLVASVSSLTAGAVLVVTGTLPLWLILAVAVLDGAALGASATCALKIQASMVRPGAEGAAEILAILRIGAGAVAGALLAGLSPSPGWTLIACGFMTTVSAAANAAVVRRTSLRQSAARGARAQMSTWSYLRGERALSGVIVIDLLLALVIPTQAVNLVLSDLDVPQIASLSIAAGMVGVLLGRVGLTVFGFRGNARVILTVACFGLAAAQIASSIGLIDLWMLQTVYFVPLVIIVGSICSTYAQGLLAATIQQVVTEDFRGRVGSIMVTGRNVLISLGAIGGALATSTIGSQVLLIILASAVLLVAIGSRWFKPVSPPRC